MEFSLLIRFHIIWHEFNVEMNCNGRFGLLFLTDFFSYCLQTSNIKCVEMLVTENFTHFVIVLIITVLSSREWIMIFPLILRTVGTSIVIHSVGYLLMETMILNSLLIRR